MFETCDVGCDLCQSRDSVFVFEAKDRLYGCEGSFTYVKCRECGLVYMNPRICGEDIGSFYPEDYAPHRSKEKRSDKCPNSLSGRWKNARPVKSVKNFRKRFLGVPATLACVRRKLGSESRVLDVGCGGGQFLDRIRSETGCHVDGVDISEAAVAVAHQQYGIDIFNGPLTDAPFPADSFDVITAWSYLEHVLNPSEVLQKMRSLLKPDGQCVIAVPNIDSFNARIFKDKWYHLDCPRHLQLYSPETVRKLLDKAGLVVTRIVYGKTPWGLFPSLRYCFGDNSMPLKQRKRPRHASLLKRLFLPWTILVGLLKQSDIIIVYARIK